MQNIIKKVGIFMGCLVLLAGCFDKKDENSITIGLSSDYPPFEFQKDGKVVGFDIDFAERVAEKLGKKLVIKDMPLYSLIPSLQNNTLDLVISGISPTEERAKLVLFTDLYYASSMAVLYNINKASISTLQDLDGKTIGVQTGTTMETFLNEATELPELTVLSQDNNNQLIEHLKIGRIDAVLLDLDQAIAFSKASAALIYLAIPTPDNYGFAAAANKDKKELIASINKLIAEMKESQELAQLKSKWLTTMNVEQDDEDTDSEDEVEKPKAEPVEQAGVEKHDADLQEEHEY